MSAGLSLALLVISIIIFLATFYFIRNGRLPIKFALLWLVAGTAILFIVIFPDFMTFMQNLFGFLTMSNFVIGILISILVFLSMALTIIVSGQKKKIAMLIQEVSILKKRVREVENEK